MAPLIQEESFVLDNIIVDFISNDESLHHKSNEHKIFAPLYIRIDNGDNDTTNTSLIYDDKTDEISVKNDQRHGAVTFNEDVHIYDHIHRSELTSDEKKNTWLNPMELQRIKKLARSEVILMDSGLGDVAVSCTRGLESRTRGGKQKKSRNRHNAFAAVMLEIDFQEDEGYVNDDMIADVYRTYSIPCLEAAQRIAIQDEIAAATCYQRIEI